MTVTETTPDRTRTMRVPRTRGAISGLLLIVLGAWGALIPFIGPYFDYSYQSNQTWVWSAARGWLEVLPGAVAAFGGLVLLVSKNRISGSFGSWLAIVAGGWFVVGLSLSQSWNLGSIGAPVSGHAGGQAIAQLGYFYGLGALIIFLGAFALGRLAVVGVRDLRAADRDDERAAEAAQQAELARQAELDRQAEHDRQAAVDREASERQRAAEREAAERQAAVDREAAERQAATEREAAERQRATERAATDQPATDRAATDRAAERPSTSHRATADAEPSSSGYDPNDGRTAAVNAPSEDPTQRRSPYDPQ